MKFGRWYRIVIQTPSGTQITIEPPFSAVFDIKRSIGASVNTGDVTLYNLSPTTRNLLYKDKYLLTEYWRMSIMAGYSSKSVYQIFLGSIQEAYSYKQGTEWITKINAYDGMYQIQNGFCSATYQSGELKQNMLKQIIQTMPECAAGMFGTSIEGKNKRGTVVFGSSFDEIQKLTNGTSYIDNEQLNTIADNEIISGEAIVLDSEALLTTPKRRDTYLSCDVLFSPEIQPGHAVEIRSEWPKYNGTYRVDGFHHAFTVSEANVGDAITTLDLYAGSRAFTEINK